MNDQISIARKNLSVEIFLHILQVSPITLHLERSIDPTKTAGEDFHGGNRDTADPEVRNYWLLPPAGTSTPHSSELKQEVAKYLDPKTYGNAATCIKSTSDKVCGALRTPVMPHEGAHVTLLE